MPALLSGQSRDRCQLGASGDKDWNPENWTIRHMLIYLTGITSRRQRETFCWLAGASGRPCIIAGMLASCLSICGSDGVVFTWHACLGGAGVGSLIWTRLCVCAVPTGDDVHLLFPRHLTQIEVGPHQLDRFPSLYSGSWGGEKQAGHGWIWSEVWKNWFYYTLWPKKLSNT